MVGTDGLLTKEELDLASICLAGPELQQLRATVHQLCQREPSVPVQQDRLPGGTGMQPPHSCLSIHPCWSRASLRTQRVSGDMERTVL